MPADFESGVFTEGKPAWHGLGVTLPSDALDTQEALIHSGLAGWNLTKQPVYTGNEEDGFEVFHSRFAVTRETDRKALGIVGSNYKIVQNEEAFDWMNTLLGGDGFHFKTAGSLRGGAVVWLLAKAPFDIDLPDSKIENYVLLTNRHDGCGSVQAAVTPVRVVCSNTLRAALDIAQAVVKIRHTRSADQKLAEAQKVLGLAEGAAERVREVTDKLANTRMSSAMWTKFLETLVPLQPDATKHAETRATKLRDSLTEIYLGDAGGQSAIEGTAWGAFNAVVAYNDHMVTSRNTDTGTPDENRFQRILQQENVTDKALAILSRRPFYRGSGN